MPHTFDDVDEKVRETEFFLRKMVEAEADWSSFRFFLSAFLSAARTTTLAIQRFGHLRGFADWYSTHRARLKAEPLARFFLETRNDHLHGGPNPVAAGSLHRGKSTYSFQGRGFSPTNDVVASCREHFVSLLAIVHDCYQVLGSQIDPQQHYTREHFASLGKTIADAEVEVWGWEMTSLVEEGFDDDDRWNELRAHVSETQLNHLFHAYLGRVTPQPVVPDHIADSEVSDVDRGWTHIPAGFASIDNYLASLRNSLSPSKGD